MSSYMRSINRIARCGILYRDEKLKKYGIRGYQNVYLFNICNNPGISQEELSRKILVNKSNVARQIAVLEKNGFVTREVSSKDRRRMCVYPTEKAKSAIPKIKKVVEQWNNELLEGFSKQERDTLSEMLQKVMEKAVSNVSADVFEPGEMV